MTNPNLSKREIRKRKAFDKIVEENPSRPELVRFCQRSRCGVGETKLIAAIMRGHNEA